ncbi:E3 SUMO-protein ligase ZBED1-like [Eleginops maclovinus]|uniref:E3 SUMO-protein ligase ZBED1-like n=1 Tax=Eleginops maclovinus TaxID=56733 RepID=UPI00308062E3
MLAKVLALRQHQAVFAKLHWQSAARTKLTNAIAKWITVDCRPINIVEDQGLQGIIQIATDDPSYKPSARGTIVTRIHELFGSEKAKKAEQLAQATFIALTGDHWTSVSNHNYLGVTAHLIDDKWELHSFALGVGKTEERHFAEACASQFLQVAKEWEITDKVTTIGTDSARNMIVAARSLPFEHMPCVAHIIQRVITVSLRDSAFDGALAKCRKIVGHFKHSAANTAELKLQQASHGQEEQSLIQDVPTCWNSTLEMIKRGQNNKDPLKATLAQQKHKLAMLTSAEYDRLAKLETLLEPCRYVTELLGGDKYVSCSVVLPALCHLLYDGGLRC